MSTPDPAHIDAVARLIDPAAFTLRSSTQPRWSTCRAIARDAATALLTSPDPAVHAAMLDALTRHGVLTEIRNKRYYPREMWERRLVTSWEMTE